MQRTRSPRGRAPNPTSSPAPRAPGWRRISGVVAALLLIWSTVFAPQLLAGRVFVAGDWPRDIRFAESSAQYWRTHHQRALWNPYVFAGLPAAASLADLRPQYLPDFALDAFEALRDAPVLPPLRLPLLAHLAGMLAAALLARALWGVGIWAMLWAGVAWGLLPNQLVPLAHGHHAQLVTVGLMPVSLLLVHQIFAAARWRGALLSALGLALVGALQIAAGHPQFAYYSLALAGALALERARHFARPRRLMLAFGAAALGVTLATATWLPMLRYGVDSVRGGSDGVTLGEVARYSIGVRDLLVLAWPGAMGFGGPTYWGGMSGTDFPQYVTPLVLLLAILAVFRPRGDSATWLLGGAALASIVLAFGAALGPVYAGLRAGIPFFAKLRVAVAILIIAQLALALLSARALDRFLTGPGHSRAFAAGVALTLAMALALLVAGRAFESGWSGIAHATRREIDPAALNAVAARVRLDTLLRLALAAAQLAALAAAGGRIGRWFGPVLIVLLAVDLGTVTLPILRGATAPRERLNARAPSDLARQVSAMPHTRGYADWLDALVRDNDWMVWRIAFLGGAHGTPPRRWEELLSSGLIRVPAVQRALAVSAVATPPVETLPVAEYERLSPPGTAPVLWRMRNALPRAYAVRHVFAPGNDMAVSVAMARTDSFPARVAFTDDDRVAGEYPGSEGCSIQWQEDEPDRVALECESTNRVFLVLADAYFAGWRARVDDVEIPIHRVNHLGRGVVVPPGRHLLTMDYRPPGWEAGVAVTRGAALIWVLLLGATLLGPGLRPVRA